MNWGLHNSVIPRATFSWSCAAAQYFRSAAHCISIDNRTTNYVLSIFCVDLFLELTRLSIPRKLSKLLEGTLQGSLNSNGMPRDSICRNVARESKNKSLEVFKPHTLQWLFVIVRTEISVIIFLWLTSFVQHKIIMPNCPPSPGRGKCEESLK